ncbi:PAS domain-containing protein (plasmid) [Agrobacterium larrymoorei]|uniref:histidine kinase n=2 Tax=Agrobacterium larrymoorei TaxID=160699 RepID=A0A4D7E3S3_9HYPH|nr:GAF domain-containing protein [Agrobacterium larrymoorei]QYA10577.1 PAS domain-containing protein [Agrobacterium larrymoorei]
MMGSGHAMCIAWGPERTFLYNEAYVPMLGARHPKAMGMPMREVWSDVWPDIEALVDATFEGETSSFTDMPLTMTRHGYPEETCWTFSYSPIRDEQGDVAGLLNVTLETTARVLAEQQRDKALADLGANEAKWRQVFETLEEGFILGEVVRNSEGQIVDWRYDEVNDAWYDLVGIEPGRALGRTIREIFPGIEDEWVLEFARVVETGEPIRFTRQVGRLERWYDGVCQPAGDDRFTVIFLEVTDRIRAEQRREALVELARILSASTNLDEMTNAATALIGKSLNVGRVGYGTVGTDGETFIVPTDWTAEGYPSLAGTYRMDDYGGYAVDLRHGRTVVISDIRLDPRTSADTAPLESVSVRSLINLPVVENGRTVAVLYVNDDKPRNWTLDEIAFIADAANRTRTALERRRAEQEAHSNASFLRSVLAASTDCIKVLNLEGELTFMSEGGMKVMEISDFNSVKGCPWPDFLKGSGGELAKNAIAAAKQGKSTHFEAFADTYLGTPKFWSVSVSPITDPDGTVSSILSVSRDHSALEEARQQQRLLNGELDHRLKNVLTIVQSIANQTLRDATTLEDASAAFSSRLASLGRATDVLTATSWEVADLKAVVEAGLTAVDGKRDRIDVEGPRIRLTPQAALALTLAIHELSTNALKYGALSNDSGSVTLGWSVTPVEGDQQLSLLWQERGGPAVSPPTRKGFGSRMIERSLRSYFKGMTSLSYPVEGVEFRIDAPLSGAGELETA